MMTITHARVSATKGRLFLHLRVGGSSVTFEVESREVALLIAAEVSRGAMSMPAPTPVEPQHHHVEGEATITPQS